MDIGLGCLWHLTFSSIPAFFYTSFSLRIQTFKINIGTKMCTKSSLLGGWGAKHKDEV